jgi:hypothetical protein
MLGETLLAKPREGTLRDIRVGLSTSGMAKDILSETLASCGGLVFLVSGGFDIVG